MFPLLLKLEDLDLDLFEDSGTSDAPDSPPAVPSGNISRKLLKEKIQTGVQARVDNFWKEKVGLFIMQGDYLALIMEEGSCVTWKSYMWDIPQGVLKFAINAGINTLPTLDNLKRWGKRTNVLFVVMLRPFCMSFRIVVLRWIRGDIPGATIPFCHQLLLVFSHY